MDIFGALFIFILGIIFDRISRSESRLSVFFSDAIAECQKLQDNCLIYWSRDFVPAEDILLQARIRSNIERINKLMSVDEEIFSGNDRMIANVLDNIIDQSTGGNFESSNKMEDYPRCLSIISLCSHLESLIRISEERISFVKKLKYFFVSPIS